MKKTILYFIKYYYFTIFLLLKMVLFFNPSNAQTEITKHSVQDTIKNQKEVKNDQSAEKSKEFFDKLENSASKNYLTQKMFGLFIRKKDLESAGRIIQTTDAIEKFRKYAGKRITEVEIVKLDAFGYSVFDTSLSPTNWAERASNRIHVNTTSFIIKNNLLFETGDLVNPVDFSESEHVVRNLPFIEDINILISPQADTNLVKVKVITKDTWSIAAGIELSSATSGEAHLYEKNLGGLGIGLNTYLYNDTKKPNEWGKKGELIVPNILGSFVRGEFGLHYGLGYKLQSYNLKRDFYASKARNGWGARIITGEEPYSFKTMDSTLQIKYLLQDYWLGRAFRVSRKDYMKSPHKLVVSVRYLNKHFTYRPVVNLDTNYYFHNKQYYLASISLTQQNLFKENLIYSFGSTEDIPTGFRIQLTSGYEISEYRKRVYLSSELTAAEDISFGYLFLSTRAGTFFSEGGRMEQSVVNLRSTYFTKLFGIGKNKYRQFVKVDYTRGFGRLDNSEGELILLGNNTGIRGLSSKNMIGTTRLAINLETMEYSNLFLYGFRFAYFLYFDFGVIGTSDFLIGNKFYNGFGLGIRIKNENLVFKTFLIRLGYYTNIPLNATINWWSINGEQKPTFENFRAKEPQIIPFE